MNELDRMSKEIRLYTLLLTLVVTLVSILLFPKAGKAVPVGVLIGSLSGMIGFQMILRMASSLEPQGARMKAYRSYLLRYLIYAAIFAISIAQGVHALALLAGILAHKASFLIYTWRHRKEDD